MIITEILGGAVAWLYIIAGVIGLLIVFVGYPATVLHGVWTWLRRAR